MGKKYIIELLDDCQSEFKGIIVFGMTPSNQISVEMIPAEDLPPYTEPDLEQVRKEAYQKGLKDSVARCLLREHCTKEAYQRGLSDAWEAARKIACDRAHGGFHIDIKQHIFGAADYAYILANYNASEAVEKIRAYEQEKDAEIKAGDVVYHVECPDIKLRVVDVDHNKIAGIALEEVDGSCDKGDLFKEQHKIKYAKTGQHFEIANVLKKMREES